MGRTLATANQIISNEQTALTNFRRALRREDQQAFDILFASARKHTAAISQANPALPFEAQTRLTFRHDRAAAVTMKHEYCRE